MEFKGTKGHWKYKTHFDGFNCSINSVVYLNDVYRLELIPELGSTQKEAEANAELIAEAGNVRQQINCSLTELLKRYHSLNSFLQYHERTVKNVLDVMSREAVDNCEEFSELDEMWNCMHKHNQEQTKNN